MPSLALNSTCDICFELFDQHLRRACTSTSGCGHIFCLDCYRNVKREQGRCPTCRNYMGAEIKLHFDVDNAPLPHNHPSAKAEAERLLQDINGFDIGTSSVDPVDANIRAQRLLSRCETFLQSHDHPDQFQGRCHLLRGFSTFLGELQSQRRLSNDDFRDGQELERKSKWRSQHWEEKALNFMALVRRHIQHLESSFPITHPYTKNLLLISLFVFLLVLFQKPSNPWACHFFQLAITCGRQSLSLLSQCILWVSSLVHHILRLVVINVRQILDASLSFTLWCISYIHVFVVYFSISSGKLALQFCQELWKILLFIVVNSGKLALQFCQELWKILLFIIANSGKLALQFCQKLEKILLFIVVNPGKLALQFCQELGKILLFVVMNSGKLALQFSQEVGKILLFIVVNSGKLEIQLCQEFGRILVVIIVNLGKLGLWFCLELGQILVIIVVNLGRLGLRFFLGLGKMVVAFVNKTVVAIVPRD